LATLGLIEMQVCAPCRASFQIKDIDWRESSFLTMDNKYGLIARMMLRIFKPGYMGISN
jgi:hypothetical protein